MASTASAEDCGSGGGVAVKHGTAGKGPVVGLVQVCMVDDDIVAMNLPGQCTRWKARTPSGKDRELVFSLLASPENLLASGCIYKLVRDPEIPYSVPAKLRVADKTKYTCSTGNPRNR